MKDEYSQAFEELGRRILSRITELCADECLDELGQEFMELAENLGLVKSRPFNPDADAINAEVGDTVFTWAHLPRGWRTCKPIVEVVDAMGNPITDPNHCGFLRINDTAAYAELLKGNP